MSGYARSTVIDGRPVRDGDRIVNFRGDVFTFSHMDGDRVVTHESHVRYLHRVFVGVLTDDAGPIPGDTTVLGR